MTAVSRLRPDLAAAAGPPEPTLVPRPELLAEAGPGGPVIDVVLPVYNEAHVLAASVAELCRYLTEAVPYRWRITIVDNASTDATWGEAQALAAHRPDVHAMRLGQRGRGRALKAAWSTSPAPVLVYMDIDLSTGLDALLPLVTSVLSGHSDLAVGSRRAPGARVRRSMKRDVISTGYNTLLRLTLRTRVRDAQCGFKAISRTVAHELLPVIEDDAWFFDTELITLAERRGLRILELPVEWIEDPDSRVRLWSTAWADLLGILRMLNPNRTPRP